MHFSDSEDEAKEKIEVGPDKEETEVMTGSKHKKANIAPPPPHPKNRRNRSLSLKPTSLESSKTTSPPQTPKVAVVTQAATQVAKPRQGSKAEPNRSPKCQVRDVMRTQLTNHVTVWISCFVCRPGATQNLSNISSRNQLTEQTTLSPCCTMLSAERNDVSYNLHIE